MPEEKLKELEEVSRSLVKWMKENCNPHQTLVISYNQIKIASDDYGIPIKND